MRRDMVLQAIFFMGIIGLAIAGYQTYEHHFLVGQGCSLSGTFSCESVTGSRFGEFPPSSGIATAAWGIPWWATVIALSGSLLAGKGIHSRQEEALSAVLLTGVGMMAYLLTAELIILPAETGELVICPFCTAQHVLIVGSVLLSIILLDRPVRSYLPWN